VEIRRGEFVVEVHGHLLNGTLEEHQGEVTVVEDGNSFPGAKWLIQRVARLSQLADRILDNVVDVEHFVTPEGDFLNTIEESPEEQPEHVNDVVACLQERLATPIPGTSLIVYLTSDAGEGKTSVINHLARLQAKAYRRHETHWLLLPVPLGGRTLLRFDDVMSGTLLNKLRFPLWYYDALIELVKLGVVVPALDGFEEMFVEGSTGEAVSSLGNLLRSLQSAGCMLIAARKAYFEYKSLDAQARLFDTIDTGGATFARLGLRRWGKRQFLEYSAARDVDNGAEIYDDVETALGPDHALLTRAVLVKRVLDEAGNAADRRELLRNIRIEPQDFFARFVETIVDREIRRWINRVAEPAQPLLDSQSHYRLVSLVAQEMWLSNVDSLSSDVLDLVADIFCESNNIGVEYARQVKERLKQHALLVATGDRLPKYAFDHEAFQDCFLGWGIADEIVDGAVPDLRRIMESGQLPAQALDTAGFFTLERGQSPEGAVEVLEDMCRLESPASFVRMNSGGLVLRLLAGREGRPLRLSRLSFPPESLQGISLVNITFDNCYFQPTSLEATTLTSCRFQRCTLERLELAQDSSISNTSFDEDCEIHSVVPPSSEDYIYDPAQIGVLLGQAGVQFEAEPQQASSSVAREPDERLSAAQRGFRAFLRAIEVNENVLKLKMGDHADDVIDALSRNSILQEVEYHGSGRQRRFRLGAQMKSIDDALSKCGGDFELFLSECNVRQ
jgi:hypothetical protein